MSTVGLIHGGCADSTHWRLLVPELEQRGHRVLLVDHGHVVELAPFLGVIDLGPSSGELSTIPPTDAVLPEQ
jgi:hypothetical protein